MKVTAGNGSGRGSSRGKGNSSSGRGTKILLDIIKDNKTTNAHKNTQKGIENSVKDPKI